MVSLGKHLKSRTVGGMEISRLQRWACSRAQRLFHDCRRKKAEARVSRRRGSRTAFTWHTRLIRGQTKRSANHSRSNFCVQHGKKAQSAIFVWRLVHHRCVRWRSFGLEQMHELTGSLSASLTFFFLQSSEHGRLGQIASTSRWRIVKVNSVDEKKKVERKIIQLLLRELRDDVGWIDTKLNVDELQRASDIIASLHPTGFCFLDAFTGLRVVACEVQLKLNSNKRKSFSIHNKSELCEKCERKNFFWILWKES